MGVDVYLLWKGQTKREKEIQYTGYSIDAGRVGYLRASYSNMHAELEVLEKIFPKEHWEKKLSYDFKKNKKMMFETVNQYIFDNQKRCSPQQMRWIIMWANSIYDFFDLGLKKQKEKKSPKIYISY